MKKKNVIYVIYVLIILVLTVYFSLSIFIFSNEKDMNGSCPCKKYGLESSNCEVNFTELSKDPSLHLELIPETEQIFDGLGVCIPPTIVKINSYGFRDYEYSLNKPNNTFRIVALGDSYTFGHGVELEETYVKVLEKLLNERKDGIKYEVLNFGVPGYNADEKVEFFASKAIKFNPDLIIFQYLDDDIFNWTEYPSFQEREIEEYAQKIGKNVSELTGMENQEIGLNAYKDYLNMLEKNYEESWKLVERSFERLSSISQNKTVLIVAFGTYGFQLSKLNNISRTYNWPILNEEDLLGAYNNETLIIPKDDHPNALANKLIAENIYQKLINDNLLPTA